ncbi:DUF3238 domain-containing protein [Planococcus sp. ISL-109]|uniref:DUF3238 domain-containing protein n=1 Tax=Planococcus sp. ISL-109 TaxID=2819166 RepID=UPI001BE6B7B2|nr:DUF3238 domain-containing protein [Planococcus sp. ISL-109]MBT2581493.1 DUF3238 domain-containing protein [Planococcus sp. ISL-109]
MSEELDIDLLEQSDSMIHFAWTPTGEVYRVKKDGETVYTGTQNAFRDEALHSGELFCYSIERQSPGGSWVPAIKLLTGTEKRNPDSINQLEQIVLSTIVSENRVSLSWGKIQGITEYEIFRDGEPQTVTTKTQYTDRDVPEDRELTYWIRGKRPVERTEGQLTTVKSLAAKAFGILNTESSKEETAMEKFWLTKKIAPLHYLLGKEDSEPPKLKWHVRYLTFLPDDVLKNPNLTSPNRYFQGDNRGFDPESKHYRTQINSILNLNKEQSEFDFDKDVGTSISYDWRRKFRKADVASSDEIKAEISAETEQKTDITITHSVGNPLTTSPNIDYEMSAKFYRNGIFDIVGMHDQAPNHEVYLKLGDDGIWQPIHQTETEGLAWMADPIASQYWRISNFL